MRSNMQILWTILVLGSLLKGAYADKDISSTSSPKPTSGNTAQSTVVTSTKPFVAPTSESAVKTTMLTKATLIPKQTEPPTTQTTTVTSASKQTETSQAPQTEKTTGATEKTTGATEKTTGATEKTTGATEKTTGATEKTTGATEKTTAPTEKTTAPTEKTTAPTDRTTAPKEKTTQTEKTTLTSQSTETANNQGSSTLNTTLQTPETTKATTATLTTLVHNNSSGPTENKHPTTTDGEHDSQNMTDKVFTSIPTPTTHITTLLPVNSASPGVETSSLNTTSPGTNKNLNIASVTSNTITTITSKSSTGHTATAPMPLNGGSTQGKTSTTPHTTSSKSKENAFKPIQFSYTVTANKNGSTLEHKCALFMDAINTPVNCKMVGHKINDDDYKFTSVLLTATEPFVPTNNSPGSTQPEEMQMTSIAILASCGALALILIAFAVYCSCHRLSYRKNQQHLTEELQTVENGYHDNPTLEVMEVHPEMQEKKPVPNGEFNDSWIVPFDNLIKDDIPDEEDTHL